MLSGFKFYVEFVFVSGLSAFNESGIDAGLSDLLEIMSGARDPVDKVSGDLDAPYSRYPYCELSPVIYRMRTESPVCMIAFAGIVQIDKLVAELLSDTVFFL